MAQGWKINATGDQIIFLEAPANGAAIEVKEYPTTSTGVTDVWATGAWSDDKGYPAEVEFFSDRLIFAGTPREPQTTWFSKAGSYVDFGRSSPIVDDDAISATLNARQQNAIRELVPLDKLIMLTTGGEWRTDGGQDDVLTPTTISFKPQSYNGAAQIPALVIGNTALYVQDRGYIVRDISYQFDIDGYSGGDLTVFSSHLTEGKPIAGWAFQKTPFSVVWVVRTDGVLLALTYMREQEVVGWTPMVIDGFVESVCSVPEGGEDAVYISVRRTINGVTKRYVERMASRLIFDIREARFLDSFLTFDGRGDGAKTMTATAATWLVGDAVTVTASGATFGPGDIGDVVVMGYQAGNNARLRITGYTSPTVVTAEIDTPIADSLRSVAITDWGLARDTLSGYEHLAGRVVGVLCDGFVQDQRTVALDGTVQLDEPGVLVHVGLPYTADFETLEVNVPGAETLRLRNKLIKRVGLIVQDTRSIFAGPDFDHLDEYESRDLATNPVGPPSLLQDLVEMWIQGEWANKGRVCVRQTDPLPMGILGAILDLEAGQ
ncbi:hypothetical protein [Luteibacter sp.]|uniref:hypothetical protein n=1 Tax=Luteibacter sp. TaxID=1886636 RepID=UPI002808CFDD|nr:hypothetical protein [Luteibacter sp.]MDQ8050738.1 hypothetical protein [Luteibacter sp.]